MYHDYGNGQKLRIIINIYLRQLKSRNITLLPKQIEDTFRCCRYKKLREILEILC